MSLYRRFHDRFGTAGVLLGVAALVLALGGSAIAASGALTGKQKKEVEKIAKKYAGKPGAPGAAGAAGPAGPAGKDGANGTNGANGLDGDNGKSVAVGTPTGAECAQGGATVEVAGEPGTKKKICNGTTGFTETLPSGKTETGAWSMPNGPGGQVTSLSFPIPLAAELDEAHVKVIAKGDPVPTDCENSGHAGAASPANPEASNGYLCLYFATGSVTGFFLFKPGNEISFPTDPSMFGASKTGMTLLAGGEATSGAGHVGGTWAVTAP